MWLGNAVKMTTPDTGTSSPITLGSASVLNQSLASAGIQDGYWTEYKIEDGTNWEVGYGRYTASGTTLTRNVRFSNNSNAPINLSGSAVIFVTAHAESLQALMSAGLQRIGGGF